MYGFDRKRFLGDPKRWNLARISNTCVARMQELKMLRHLREDVMRKHIWLTGVLLAAWNLPAMAQEVTIGGQLRPRYEFNKVTGTADQGAVSMRTRANIDALLEDNIRVFIQFQDVRYWGEEGNTLTDFSADYMDLHQGYVEIQQMWGSDLTARIGRQEFNLGGQRLVGAVGWTQQGRSFDGIRLTLNSGSTSLDLFGFKNNEAGSPTHNEDADFAGFQARMGNIAGGALELYTLYRRDIEPPSLFQQFGDNNEHEVTMGARYAASRGNLSYRFEGSYQVGERKGPNEAQKVGAFMFGGRVGSKLGDRLTATLWFDYLSGDDSADDKQQVFNTLFATNHKFYGFADLFLNIPAHTGGLGLQDAAVKLAFQATDDIRFNADIHSFMAAKQGALSTRRLAEELDLTLVHNYSSRVTMQGGLSYVMQADGLGELGRLADDRVWAYVMINAAW